MKYFFVIITALSAHLTVFADFATASTDCSAKAIAVVSTLNSLENIQTINPAVADFKDAPGGQLHYVVFYGIDPTSDMMVASTQIYVLNQVGCPLINVRR